MNQIESCPSTGQTTRGSPRSSTSTTPSSSFCGTHTAPEVKHGLSRASADSFWPKHGGYILDGGTPQRTPTQYASLCLSSCHGKRDSQIGGQPRNRNWFKQQVRYSTVCHFQPLSTCTAHSRPAGLNRAVHPGARMMPTMCIFDRTFCSQPSFSTVIASKQHMKKERSPNHSAPFSHTTAWRNRN